MTLNVAVQMDPIERINVRGDSTFALLLEAQARGHKLSYYTPDRMAMAPDGSPLYFRGDLADPDTRRKMLSKSWNFFGPTVAGYRLSTYRRMPEGWAPAPPGIWSDLHMWRKFLRLDGITVGTRSSIQSLCLHNSLRRHMTQEQRRDETARWIAIIRDPARRADLVDRYCAGFTARRSVPAMARLLHARGRALLRRMTAPAPN